jgi:O-antigen/teichoic acid export membrane protein
VVLIVLLWPEFAPEAAWLFMIAAGITALVGQGIWRQRAGIKAGAPERVDKHAILASCLPLLVVAGFTQAVSWSSQLMLGVWSTSADVAVFNAAQRTAMLTSFVLIAVNTIAAPKFAAMYRTEQHDALRRLARQATAMMVLFSLLPLSAMLLFPGEILLLFGPEFSDGATSLRVLALGQFVNVATGSVGYLLAMTGNERLLRNNVMVAAGLSVGMGVVLIPLYGLVGGAIATSAGVALHNLLGVRQVRRVLGFNTLAIWRWRRLS